MKELNLLTWIVQLGLSVAAPLTGFILLAVWLHSHCGWGKWVIFVGLILGISGAVSGLRSSLKMMERMSKDKKEEKADKPSVSFNEHE